MHALRTKISMGRPKLMGMVLNRDCNKNKGKWTAKLKAEILKAVSPIVIIARLGLYYFHRMFYTRYFSRKL